MVLRTGRAHERHRATGARDNLEAEDAPVEVDRALQIADLEDGMVQSLDSDGQGLIVRHLKICSTFLWRA